MKLVELLETLSRESWWLELTKLIAHFERAAKSMQQDEICLQSENPETSPEFYYAYVNRRDAAQAAAVESLEAIDAMRQLLIEAGGLLKANAPQLFGRLPSSELVSLNGIDEANAAEKCRLLLGEVLALDDKKDDTAKNSGKNLRKPTKAATDCGREYIKAHREDPSLSRKSFIENWAELHKQSAASIERILVDNPQLCTPKTTNKRHVVKRK